MSSSFRLSNHRLLRPAGSEHDRLRPQPYYSSIHGSVYYTPRTPTENHRRAAASPSFPPPLIQPRQRRPHSIHIVSYPAGFIPHDLRPTPPSIPNGKVVKQEKEDKKGRRSKRAEEKRAKKEEEKAEREKSEKRRSLRSLRSLPPSSERVGRVIGKILAVLSITPKATQPTVTTTPKPQSRPSSFIGFARRLSRLEPTVVEDAPVRQPERQPESQPQNPSEEIPAQQEPVRPVAEPPNMATAALPRPLHSGAINPVNRDSMMSVRSAKSIVSSSVTEVPKPVASGSGVTCSIILAEPNIFLTGLDHDNHSRQQPSQNSSALLRGKLRLNVSKNVKIKSVILKLVGKARTEWPEGIPPLKVELFEEHILRAQSLIFFHAVHDMVWETEYGNQCTFKLEPKTNTSHLHSHSLRNSFYSNHSINSMHVPGSDRPPNSLTAKELKRLSLQSVNSRSFGKGDSPLANQVQAKGYKIFPPGTYEYSFEVPIDHSQLETTKLQYGSVKWELQTTVERTGAFRANLHGSKEVMVVRLPDQMSLEMSEPISISRQWEDQLYYDIMISGKSFPIGAKIPIAFKLTPLAKVQVHKLKVFVTESIEYWTNDRRVTRKDGGRKILLLEKTAGKPLDRQFSASDIRIVSGGELQPEQREEARRTAAARRIAEASRTGRTPEPLQEPCDNLLGDLDLGLESFWGSTEIEMNVQIPTCDTMAREKMMRLHPDCSWKNVNVFHWIKIVMRISRLDPDDPAGKRRRHFEINIDSPFTVLNCRATQPNTSLPQYCGREPPPEQRRQTSCGCPDAQIIDPSPSSSTSHLPLLEQDINLDCVSSSALPNVPRAAHFQGSSRLSHTVPQDSDGEELPSSMERDRPIHLLRHPSFNPPAFDADDAPPPADLVTPPPNYDAIIGTPSVDGMADYFARLAIYEGPVASIQNTIENDPLSPTAGQTPTSDALTPDIDPLAAACNTSAAANDDSSDSGEDDPARPHRRGRVNVANPRTPGGRLVPSRSLEIERPLVRLNMTSVIPRGLI